MHGSFPQLPREMAPDLLTAPGFAAAIGLATHLMMTAQWLLRSEVSRTFHLASAGFGLTEVRCLFLARTSLGYGDMLGIAWIVVNLGLDLAGTIRPTRPALPRRAAGRQRPLKEDASTSMSCQKWIE